MEGQPYRPYHTCGICGKSSQSNNCGFPRRINIPEGWQYRILPYELMICDMHSEEEIENYFMFHQSSSGK